MSDFNILVQSGAVGIAILLIFMIYRIIKMVLDVIQKNTAAQVELKSSLDLLSSAVSKMDQNQHSLGNIVEKTITDQNSIGRLQYEALTTMTKELRSLKRKIHSGNGRNSDKKVSKHPIYAKAKPKSRVHSHVGV